MSQVVCPIISTGNQILQCHPMCKFLDSDGECKIAMFMDNIEKLTKGSSSED